MTTNFIEIGDTHINSTVALAIPGFNLDDGGTYKLSRTQSWLWSCWLEFWQEVDKLDGRKIVCFKGDLGELDTMRRSVQIITGNKASIINLVQRTIEPAVERADQMIFIRGTSAHSGKGCWLEEVIANDYDHTIRAENTASWYHLRTVIDKVRFDITHHCSMSGLPWNRNNSANRLAQKVFWQYTHDMGQPAPDIATRAHNHKLAESTGFKTYVSCAGAWTPATEYCYRIGRENDFSDIAGIIWELDNGTYKRRVIKFEPKEMRRVWALKI